MPSFRRGEAALYIADMAGSLKRIAVGYDLQDLAHRLAEVEHEALRIGSADSR